MASNCTRWIRRSGCTMLNRVDERRPGGRGALRGRFERNWSVGSFTSLTRHTVAPPMRAQEKTCWKARPGTPETVRAEDAPWHRFPRGSVPGNFLHEQLEWMGQEGFETVDDPEFEDAPGAAHRARRLGQPPGRCAGLAARGAVTHACRRSAPALAEIVERLPEMEFWFPSEHLDVGALDRLCRRRLLGKVARPTLPERALHGMLKGLRRPGVRARGRYWVLDYKSNALGTGRRRLHAHARWRPGMAEHRYDIQGAIYMLALHRLLRAAWARTTIPRAAGRRRVPVPARDRQHRPMAATCSSRTWNCSMAWTACWDEA
jgi:exodeoxyribonuclease V beta subunit